MSDTELADLRTWAESPAPAGSARAVQVLALLAERDALTAALADQRALNLGLADRVHRQSELLGKFAGLNPLLAPLVEFVRRLAVSGSVPDAAMISFTTRSELTPAQGLTVGHLRAVAALAPVPPLGPNGGGCQGPADPA